MAALGQLAVLIPWIYLKFISRLSKMARLGLFARPCTSSGERDGTGVQFVIQHYIYHRGQGVLALYSGLSASLLRQLTYSTTRFAIYNVAKQTVAPNGEKIPFFQSLLMAAGAGACGGFIGTPGDMVNVRMQNDVKLPPEQRRK